jgi:predicted DNA binding protein
MSDALSSAPGLTDEEERVVAAALDAGYYEQPRKTTHTELALRLGTDPATVATLLRRAESSAMVVALRNQT